MPGIFFDALRKHGTLSIAIGFTLLATSLASAATPAEKLVPETTRGFLTIPDFRDIQVSFEKTEIGKLTEHPEMKPFFEDLEEQINEQFGQMGVRLGIDWRQIADVVSGEVAVAVIEPQKHQQKHAVALVADVTGKNEEVNKLLDSLDKRMQKRGANRKQENVDGTTLVVYEVPPKKRSQRGFDVAIFVHAYKDANGDESRQLIAADHDGVARDLLEQVQSKVESPTLSDVNAYRQIMARCEQDAKGLAPQMRWFIEPMGYARVTRESIPNRKPRRNDILGAIESQGFSALEGIGGYGNLATGPHELLIRAMVYAPGNTEDPERFKLAARILNGAEPVADDVQNWVPKNVSGYHTAAWDIEESFEYVGTLVDEIAGEPGFFDDLLESLEVDPNGPQINIEKEIIAHIGNRLTLISDTTLPITPESERLLLAISLKDANAMKRGIEKIMDRDPNAERHEVGDTIVWLITSPEEEDLPSLDIDGGGLDDFDDFGDDEELDEDDPLLQIDNTAICVVEGHLMVSSHLQFIAEIIQRKQVPQSPLANSQDYKAIMDELGLITGNQAQCIRSFTRVDDAVHATYELFKHSRLPESKGIVGRLLNRAMAPKEKGELRKQKFDAKKLPDFKIVQQHLGPAGAWIQLDPDGWIGTVIMLRPQGKDVVEAAVSTARSR